MTSTTVTSPTKAVTYLKKRPRFIRSLLPPCARRVECIAVWPGRLDETRPRPQRLAVEARDLLVAIGDRLQLRDRDHVLDSREALALRALPDLAQDRIGRIGAVGQHDFRGRRIAHGLVLLQRL